MSSYWFLRRSFSSQLAFSPWSPSKGGSPAPKAGLAAILVLLLLAPVILLLPALRPPIGWAFGFAGLVEVCRVHPMRAYSHRGEIFYDNWEEWGAEIPSPIPYY